MSGHRRQPQNNKNLDFWEDEHIILYDHGLGNQKSVIKMATFCGENGFIAYL